MKSGWAKGRDWKENKVGWSQTAFRVQILDFIPWSVGMRTFKGEIIHTVSGLSCLHLGAEGLQVFLL